VAGTGSFEESPQSGDPQVDVEALFAEYAGRVLVFTHRMLGNWADAEDVTQESFLKAYQQAQGFDGRCAPSTWLFAIARNTCLDRLRIRRSRSFDSLETLVREANRQHTERRLPGGDAETEAQWGWYVEAVREGCLLATLSCLTVDQRGAFVLRVLCDLSVKDTAVVLDRSNNAVRVLASRAKARLKAFLCRNCSLYNPDNPCRCQNLVGFSLARGWISAEDRRIPRGQAVEASRQAAIAIEAATRLSDIYRSLDVPELGPDLAARFAAALDQLAAVPDPTRAERPWT